MSDSPEQPEQEFVYVILHPPISQDCDYGDPMSFGSIHELVSAKLEGEREDAVAGHDTGGRSLEELETFEAEMIEQLVKFFEGKPAGTGYNPNGWQDFAIWKLSLAR